MQIHDRRRITRILTLLIGSCVVGLLVTWYAISIQNAGEIVITPFTDRCLYQKPDVLVRSQSLAKLPEDLKNISYIRDFFDSAIWEDVQQAEARLSIAGTLYRIFHENKLANKNGNSQLPAEDIFMRFLLDEPAEVALWGGVRGTWSDAMVIIPSSLPKDFLLSLAALADVDPQLSSSILKTQDGETIKALALDYGSQRKLHFAEYQGYVYVVTNNECALPVGKNAHDNKRNWQGYPKNVSLLASHYQLPNDDVKQEVFFSARYISGGYDAFLEGLQGMRATFTDNAWKVEILTEKNFSQPQMKNSLWNEVPSDIAFCLSLPVDQKAVSDLIEKRISEMNTVSDSSATQEQTRWPTGVTEVAVCWMKDAAYYTPLFIARRDPLFQDENVKKIFDAFVGSGEKKEANSHLVSPVKIEERGDVIIFSRDVSSPLGIHAAKDSENANILKYPTFFKPALAMTRDRFIFSPDISFVERALMVREHRIQSLADVLPEQASLLKDLSFSTWVYRAGLFRTFFKTNMNKILPVDWKAPAYARVVPYLDQLGQKDSVFANWGNADSKTLMALMKIQSFPDESEEK